MTFGEVTESARTLLKRCDSEYGRLQRKVSGSQRGIPTFFDQLLFQGLRRIRQLAESSPDEITAGSPATNDELVQLGRLLLEYADDRSRPRFHAFDERLQASHTRTTLPWELTPYQSAALQGLDECVHWRGIPIFKSVFDLALYPMLLWELKPRTILELGAGLGASALWFADLLATFGIDGTVVSVDEQSIHASHPKVKFIQGDCTRISEVLPTDLLTACRHPWLVIEDVHVNTAAILNHLLPLFEIGDYLVVEDAPQKRDIIRDVLHALPQRVIVDTRFTDFFGRNTTSATDAILVRVPDSR